MHASLYTVYITDLVFDCWVTSVPDRYTLVSPSVAQADRAKRLPRECRQGTLAMLAEVLLSQERRMGSLLHWRSDNNSLCPIYTYEQLLIFSDYVLFTTPKISREHMMLIKSSRL